MCSSYRNAYYVPPIIAGSPSGLHLLGPASIVDLLRYLDHQHLNTLHNSSAPWPAACLPMAGMYSCRSLSAPGRLLGRTIIARQVTKPGYTCYDVGVLPASLVEPPGLSSFLAPPEKSIHVTLSRDCGFHLSLENVLRDLLDACWHSGTTIYLCGVPSFSGPPASGSCYLQWPLTVVPTRIRGSSSPFVTLLAIDLQFSGFREASTFGQSSFGWCAPILRLVV